MVLKRIYTGVLNGQNFVLACVLFIASSVFTDLFQYLVTQAYGLPSDWVSSACKFDCEWYTSILNKGYYLEPMSHPILILRGLRELGLLSRIPFNSRGGGHHDQYFLTGGSDYNQQVFSTIIHLCFHYPRGRGTGRR